MTRSNARTQFMAMAVGIGLTLFSGCGTAPLSTNAASVRKPSSLSWACQHDYALCSSVYDALHIKEGTRCGLADAICPAVRNALILEVGSYGCTSSATCYSVQKAVNMPEGENCHTDALCSSDVKALRQPQSLECKNDPVCIACTEAGFTPEAVEQARSAGSK